MSIKPACDFCKKELTEFGGLLFSPPKKNGEIKKFHVCTHCSSPHPKIRSSRVARDVLVSARRDEEAVVCPLRRSRNEAGRENLSNPMRDTVNLARHIVASPRRASSNPSSALLVSRKILQHRGRRDFELGAIDVKKIVVGG